MKNLIVLIVVCFSAAFAHAEMRDPRHEIVVGVNPLAGFGGQSTGGDFYTDFSTNYIASVAAAYNVAVLRYLQLGVNTSFAFVDVGAASTAKFLQLVGGPTLNIPFTDDWLYNSLFVSAFGGMLLVDSGSSSTDAMLLGEVGYRLPLAEHVTWHPSVGTLKVLNGSKFLFLARPVAFSFVF